MRLDGDERLGSETIKVTHDGVVIGTLANIVEVLGLIAHPDWPAGLVFDMRIVAVVDGRESGTGAQPECLNGGG